MKAIYGQLLDVAERLHPDGLFHVRGAAGERVAITIDDGPSSRTGEILDLLSRYGARATFFVHTDRCETVPAGKRLLGRMLEEGHEVANHMPDPRVSVALPADEFAREFERAHRSLEKWGHRPRFFRAAGGLYHAERMLPALRRLDYFHRFILASYLPWDTHLPFPHRYAEQLAAWAFPGAIFVLHDGDQAPGNTRLARTIRTLEHLCRRLKSGGYTPVTLGELLASVP